MTRHLLFSLVTSHLSSLQRRTPVPFPCIRTSHSPHSASLSGIPVCVDSRYVCREI